MNISSETHYCKWMNGEFSENNWFQVICRSLKTEYLIVEYTEHNPGGVITGVTYAKESDFTPKEDGIDDRLNKLTKPKAKLTITGRAMNIQGERKCLQIKE